MTEDFYVLFFSHLDLRKMIWTVYVSHLIKWTKSVLWELLKNLQKRVLKRMLSITLKSSYQRAILLLKA